MSAGPRAGGLPLDPAVADQAAEWLTLMMSGESSEDDRRRWAQWRDAHPDHDRAWRHVETVMGRMRGFRHEAVRDALLPSPRRRGLLGVVAGVGVTGFAGALGARSATGRHWLADLRTETGEQRDVTLADGTRLRLATASAVDVRFDGGLRRLVLVAGEVGVTTAHPDGDTRPFVVETSHGRVQALGTRFTVRRFDDRTRVLVAAHAVVVRPADAPDAGVRVAAGEELLFTRTGVGEVTPASDSASAWLRGQIVADDQRLDEFLAELARHRPGLLGCDRAVAALRVSGVFPLDDTDRVLAMLPHVLPVQVRRRTRWWVTVGSPD